MKTYDTPDEIVHEKTYLYPHLRYLCIVKAGSCYEQAPSPGTKLKVNCFYTCNNSRYIVNPALK